LQKAALDVLAKTEPANAFQAESIVRQVRETSLVSETQESLFGDEVLTTSLFMERAKVLDRAQKQLRKDKSSFQNLIKNATRLEDEGNLLARDANQRRAQEDGKAVALLQSQANRKGALSDALTAAATTPLQLALSKMSDEQFQQASLTAQKLAMLDALSMLQMKSRQYELAQRKAS
jgi:hypothetical protein